MARRSSSSPRSSGRSASRRVGRRASPPPSWPTGPVETSFSTVELSTDTDGTEVMVLVGGVESSHLNLRDATVLEFEYMQHMQAILAACYPTPEPLRALHLGAAGCTMARAIDAQWPNSRQLAVEIDARLAQYMREWFDLPRSPLLRIRVADAREVVQAPSPARYEVILRDAFADGSVPAHLCTVEFLREVAAKLTDGGIYLANLADSPPLAQARREAATLADVFSHVGVVVEPSILRGRRYGNIVLIGSMTPLPGQLARRLRSLPVAARLLTGAEARSFWGDHPVFADPASDAPR